MAGERSSVRVVGVKEIDDRMPMEEWDEQMPLPGDILMGIADLQGCYHFITSSFPGGKAGVNYRLRRLNRETQKVSIRVRRGQLIIDLKACIVPENSLHNKFTLRASSDERHIVMLEDCTEERCIRLQAVTEKVLKASACFKPLNCEAIAYNWKKKLQNHMPLQGGNPVIFSVLFMPFASEENSNKYRPVEDTTAACMAWLYASQSAGAPLIFVNIQSEHILVQCSDVVDSSVKAETDHCSTNSGQYSIQCNSETTTISIMKGVRLWYLPGVAEIAVDLNPIYGEMGIGIGIGRTDEGFCYISSVDKLSAAERAGLRAMLKRAEKANKLLVLSRIGGKNVTPWKISCRGSICCYNINDLIECLSLALERMKVLKIHVMAWDEGGNQSASSSPCSFFTPQQSPMALDHGMQ